MQPLDLNAGRFYLRQLRHDDRVDDAPALTRMLAAHTPPQELPADFFERAKQDWANDTAYRWAVAEQTQIEMVAMAVVKRGADGAPEISFTTAHDPDRVLPGDDAVLVPVTVGDAVESARSVLRNWATSVLANEV